ncbi:MAG: hypothetical protein H7211_04755 [Aquabacterium sp.]|nr:hypothetical protein [Ferruginibacter sp.]
MMSDFLMADFWRALYNHLLFYCPGKEAAMVIIVVSLPCTAYLWASLIVF